MDRKINVQIIPNEATVKFDESLKQAIGERLARRKIEKVEDYLLELVQADTAETRLELWRAKFPPKIEVPGRREKAAERVRLILDLSDAGVCPAAIAERMHVSLNTVHRIKREHTGD
jgi:DNA-binding NarL/FixJ family response regulator